MSFAIVAVMGLTVSRRERGMREILPHTMITAMVSPTARPIPSTTEAMIPDFAAGMVTLKMVSTLEAPRARDPSLYSFGTARRDVSDMLTMVGRIMADRMTIMAKRLLPVVLPRRTLI